MILHTTLLCYSTSIHLYLLMLNQSQGGHFWHETPARRRLCVQNKCTPAHTPLRGWSDSEIMGQGGGGGGGRGGGREGNRMFEEEQCEKDKEGSAGT